MSLIEKIGYFTIIFWGCRFVRKIIHMLYKTFLSPGMPIDLYSMGKWGVITGCSHGLGKAYAEALAKMGINVVLVNATGIDMLRVIASDIESIYNVRTKVIELDLSQGLQAYELIEKETFGMEVGILINNLGKGYPHPEYFLDLPHKEKIYMNIIQCNVVVVTNMCRIFLPQMVLRGRGVIVNVAASVAVMPSPMLTVFAASKAYILKFSKDLSAEYAKHGIIIQCLLPGSLTNTTSKSSSNGWIIPTPDNYVASAINTIGKDDNTTGFFPHTVVVNLVRIAYKLSAPLVIKFTTSAMEGNRSNALRRYIE
ncbi:very-long-chain 3-oxoacyl-CoA reductase-like [Neodiprion lecontei]|uniref:Very-long-chain 3-oxoacyl-CoA reductase-like n=1 Tax=Neodiprion lecontei TaxID=441921 RepID=A0ABM3G9Q9_NEOLC|nr:very-long-chain 3-oxoacyl-CoA reductase-like [Neodiprion pinetum]XP_046597001.1 very-long-chain 3-oxoacyl-CoA reductase-like [Neodiprion lecontei]